METSIGSDTAIFFANLFLYFLEQLDEENKKTDIRRARSILSKIFYSKFGAEMLRIARTFFYLHIHTF